MDVTNLIGNVGASAAGSIISKLTCYPLGKALFAFDITTS